MNNSIITIIQIVVSVLLITVILLQQSDAGVGGVFGGGGEVYGVKRGAEKVLFRITIILAALFLIIGGIQIF